MAETICLQQASLINKTCRLLLSTLRIKRQPYNTSCMTHTNHRAAPIQSSLLVRCHTCHTTAIITILLKTTNIISKVLISVSISQTELSVQSSPWAPRNGSV